MADEYRPDNRDRKFDPTRCKAGVWSSERWARYSQCSRKPVADGWCKQHNPDVEAARQAASKANYEAQWRARCMGVYGEHFMAALVKIRDGDNDPRETARLALEGCPYSPALIAFAVGGVCHISGDALRPALSPFGPDPSVPALRASIAIAGEF